jgi:hypothetical protein
MFGEPKGGLSPSSACGPASTPHSQKINFNLDGTNYADPMYSDENMLTINWADWDEFVRDAEGGPDLML